MRSGEPATHTSDETDYRNRLSRALGDDYELSDLIGRGGFGVVYRAWDMRLERAVAVKALRHDLFPTPELLQRFDREAKAVAKLRHPNILPIYAVGEGEGVAYMVMPFVEGDTLQSCLDGEEGFAVEEVIRITSEAAGALEAAHKLGMIHRDVKPANIMLEGEERRVLLMDFGIAKVMTADETAITGTGMILGSPAYMSPEQTAGDDNIDGRSDIYSLGALAYELFSGQRPFEAKNLHELVYKQVTQEVADIGKVVPDLPVNVTHAVMRCLEKEPGHRWQAAADFRKAISVADAVGEHGMGYAAPEEDSWLSRRGPYVLLLLFGWFFVGVYRHMLSATDGFDVFNASMFAWFLGYVETAMLVMLGVALADVLIRIAVRIFRGHRLNHVARFALGQPAWWQTWFPRSLRVPNSVWDRLPFSIKLLRTLVWIGLIIVPVSVILNHSVLPTFYNLSSVYNMLPPNPFLIPILVETWAIYVTPLTAALYLWQDHLWCRRHGVPRLAFLASFFNLRGSYWQGSPVRVMLKD